MGSMNRHQCSVWKRLFHLLRQFFRKTFFSKQCMSPCMWKTMAAFVVCLIRLEIMTVQCSVIVDEGEMGVISFDLYKDESQQLSYDIRYGNGLPFYENGHLQNDRLNTAQQGRLRVAEEQDNQNNSLIYVIFNETKRTDGGTYLCRLYKKEGSHDSLVSLIVHFSPGNVSCTWSSIVYHEWHTLICEARGGNPPGNIICLQGDTKLRLIHYVQGDDDKDAISSNIEGKFSIQQTGTIQCCAQNVINKFSPCDDFCWPSPCIPSTTPITRSTVRTFSPRIHKVTQSTSIKPVAILTELVQQSESCAMSPLSVSFAILFCGSLCIIAILVMCLYKISKVGISKKGNNACDEHNHEGTPLTSGNEQCDIQTPTEESSL